MTTLFEAVKSTVFSKWALFAVITVAVLCAAGVFVTRTYIMPSIKPTYAENNEFIPKESGDSKTIDLILFYTSWCPYSKTAMETWLKMKPDYNGSKVNGVEVRMMEVDCDQEPETADANDIKEYPTIVASFKNKSFILDSKPTADNIKALAIKAIS